MSITRNHVGGNEYSNLRKDQETGSAAIALSVEIIRPTRLQSVTVKFSAAPSTSENMTITLDANAGAAYDVLLYSFDPSSSSATDIVWTPDSEMYFEAGDSIDVAFTNTDGNTYGIQATSLEMV